MAFFDNLINGIKGRIQQNNLNNQGDVQPIENNVPQNNLDGATKINNVLNRLRPSTWDDDTKQKVLLASKFLTGFGGTQYDPNAGLMGNMARGFSNGANSAYKQIQNYGNYKQVKGLYDQMGYDSSSLSPLGDYSGFTPASMISAGAKMKQNQVRQEIANSKDKTTKMKMIFDAVNKGYMSTEEAKLQLQALNFDTNVQDSNDTRITNSQIALNNAKQNKTNKEAAQVGKPKTTITIKQGGTKSTVTHNNSSGGNTSGNTGNNNTTIKVRPVGQRSYKF